MKCPSWAAANVAVAATMAIGITDQNTVGTKRAAQHTTNMMSATLSNAAPVLLSAWSLLARVPSTISLMPHNAYSTQNSHPVTSQNSRLMEPAILSIDITFGKCFILLQSLRHLATVFDRILHFRHHPPIYKSVVKTFSLLKQRSYKYRQASIINSTINPARPAPP